MTSDGGDEHDPGAADGTVPAMLAVFGAAAARVRDALVRPRPAPASGEWSAADVIRHLIAVEREVWQPRADQLGRDPAPVWSSVEPGLGDPPADGSDEELADAFADARAETVRRFRSLDEAGWARVARHETFGAIDAAGLLRVALDHDEEHLQVLDSN